MSKLNLQSIYKDFSNIVRERKKDFAGPFHKLYGTAFTALGHLMKQSDAIANLLHNPSQSEKLKRQESKFASGNDFTEENL